MIVMNENTIGLWWVNLADFGQDFMGGAYRDDEGVLKFDCRMRDHIDDKTLDSKDRKEWYTYIARDKTEDELIAWVRDMCNTLSEAGKEMGGECDIVELLMDEDGVDAMLEKMKELPFVQYREETRH